MKYLKWLLPLLLLSIIITGCSRSPDKVAVGSTYSGKAGAFSSAARVTTAPALSASIKHADKKEKKGAMPPAGTCKIIVPANPLTATGLATPWKLVGCSEANTGQSVFLQAVVFDPAAKTFSVYPPLVTSANRAPAIMPTPPSLPAGAVVAIWGGGNDTTTVLIGAGRKSCVNGLPGSPFGQVFFCGASEFFAAVNAAAVQPPALGTASDGLPCPTVRDFAVVDQDQSDNVQTTYLVLGGKTAQNTAVNRALLPGAAVIANPSDNRVLSIAMDTAMGCTPWVAPDISDGGNLVPSQALDELQAAALQAAPQALIPSNDPMVLADGEHSLRKINLYRAGVDQTLAASLKDASTVSYCKNILATAPARLLANKTLFLAANSPVPAIGNSLYTFLAARLQFTLNPMADGGLGCVNLLGITNPVVTVLDSQGVAVSATINGK